MLAVAAIAGLVALAYLVPLGLRHLPVFRVRRVELVGVRYLAPERVLHALALAPDQNLFDPLGGAQERVRRLAGVVSAEVTRRLPGTVRVEVVEQTPVAFVSGAHGMIALDCDAHPLPYDPTASGLDLPLVQRADTTLVRTLCIVRASDSALYDDVEIARHGRGGAVTLDLGRQRVLLRSLPTTDDIRAVGVVRRHLAATNTPAAELDARFAGWVVARRRHS